MRFLEELRRARNLVKQINAEYGVVECFDFADILAWNGVTELTDEIKEKICFLQSVCEKFSFEYNSACLVVHESMEELEKRYRYYTVYTGKTTCSSADLLSLSSEKLERYLEFFQRLCLDDKQLKHAAAMVIKLGKIAKSTEDGERIVEALDCFLLRDEERNQFICENADYLFNDYSRNAERLFASLCEEYGAEQGFAHLKEHPEWIRLGR